MVFLMAVMTATRTDTHSFFTVSSFVSSFATGDNFVNRVTVNRRVYFGRVTAFYSTDNNFGTAICYVGCIFTFFSTV